MGRRGEGRGGCGWYSCLSMCRIQNSIFSSFSSIARIHVLVVTFHNFQLSLLLSSFVFSLDMRRRRVGLAVVESGGKKCAQFAAEAEEKAEAEAAGAEAAAAEAARGKGGGKGGAGGAGGGGGGGKKKGRGKKKKGR